MLVSDPGKRGVGRAVGRPAINIYQRSSSTYCYLFAIQHVCTNFVESSEKQEGSLNIKDENQIP
jgi:hypothetical protein